MATTSEPTGSVKLAITGMTCGHCVSHVKEELSALENVKDVHIELNPKGVSNATVVLSGPVTDDQLREAVDEAGYEIAEIRKL